MHDTGDSVSVDPFIQTLGTVSQVPICTLAMAYDDPQTFHTYILFFHQSLYIKDLSNFLMAPFQIRHHGISVHDVPLQHLAPEHRTDNHHSIHIPSIDLHIPLSLQGTMSGFTFRKPTWDEVNDKEQHSVTHVDMTSPAPWNPHSPTFADHEASIRQSIQPPFDLRTPSHRQFSPLQVRGLAGGRGPFDFTTVHPARALYRNSSRKRSMV